MKKQYLISLLGMAAISISAGSALLDTNFKQITSENSSNEYKSGSISSEYNTGVSVKDSSYIKFEDVNKSNTLDKGDIPESILFETSYDKEARDWNLHTGDTNWRGMNIYSSNSDKPIMHFSYNQVNKYGHQNENASYNKGALSVSINRNDFPEDIYEAGSLGWFLNDYWYDTDKNPATETFYATAEYQTSLQADGEMIYGEDLIGNINLNEGKALSIKQTEDVNVIDTHQATVSYVVDPGMDFNGNDNNATVESVVWMDADDDYKWLGASLAPSYEGTVHSNKFTPNKTYDNTFVEAKMSDGSSVLFDVNDFTMRLNEPSIIKQTSDVNVLSQTEAKVDYEITPGKDASGYVVDVREVKWMNGNDVLASSNTEAGTLSTNKLTPNTTYSNTKMIAIMADGSKAEINVNDFTTRLDKPSIIEQTSDVNILSQTEAKVDYKITPGKDISGDVVGVKEVKWMNGDDELASSNSKAGTLSTDKLTPNTTYSNTKIVAIMSDDSKAEINVKEFNEGNVAPEISQINHVKVDYNSDILNVGGSIETNGSKINDIYFTKDEQKIHTEDVEIVDTQTLNSNEITYNIWTKEYFGEEVNGSPDLQGYSIAIEYETDIFEESFSSTTTDEHSNSISEEKISEEELSPLLNKGTVPTDDQLGGWAIFGIIISVFLLVGIIGYLGYYFYNKNNTNNKNDTDTKSDDETVKSAKPAKN